MDGQLNVYMDSTKAPIVHECKIGQEPMLRIDQQLFFKLDKDSSKTKTRQSKAGLRKVKNELQHQTNLKKVLTANQNDINSTARSYYLDLEKEADEGMLKSDDSFYTPYARNDFFRHSVAEKYFKAAKKAKKLGDIDSAIRLFKKCAFVYENKLDSMGGSIKVLKRAIKYLEPLEEFEKRNELYQEILKLYSKIYEADKKELEIIGNADEDLCFAISGITHTLINMADCYEKINGSEELIKSLYNEAAEYLLQQEEGLLFEHIVSDRFVAAICYEKAQNFELANKIFQEEFDEELGRINAAIHDFENKVDELNKATTKKDKEKLYEDICFGMGLAMPYISVAKALALKTNNLDQFCYLSEKELEVMEKIIKSVIFSKKNWGVDEFIKEAQQVSDLDDYRDVIEWSCIDGFVELAEAYALQCDQINPVKATQTRNKIAQMKEYFKFDQLENFSRFFDSEVEKALEVSTPLDFAFQGSVRDIVDLFEDDF